jgi:hypothetical protein
LPQEKIDPSLFSDDTREFIALLDRFRVRYLLVGGEAVIYYGHARLTGDADFVYDPSLVNARNLYTALDMFWGGNIPGVSSPEELTEPDLVIQFGVPPNRIDLINTIAGVTFDQAWESRVVLSMDTPSGAIDIQLIGLEDLIKKGGSGAPEGSGRPQVSPSCTRKTLNSFEQNQEKAINEQMGPQILDRSGNVNRAGSGVLRRRKLARQTNVGEVQGGARGFGGFFRVGIGHPAARVGRPEYGKPATIRRCACKATSQTST